MRPVPVRPLTLDFLGYNSNVRLGIEEHQLRPRSLSSDKAHNSVTIFIRYVRNLQGKHIQRDIHPPSEEKPLAERN
jgi:hypothetical protein